MALASGVKIEIDGVELDDYSAVEIEQSIYGLNTFKVVCRLESIESMDVFVMQKSKSYIGSSIVITVDVSQKGDGTEPGNIVFKGIITNLDGSRTGLFNNDNIIISGKSPEFLLDDIPGSRSFENKNLKQIVDEVLKPYPRDLLKSKIDPASNIQFDYTVQYQENNYHYLRRLAKRYGEWMFYDGTEFNFGKLPSKSKTDLTLGVDQTEFEYGLVLKPMNFNFKFHDYHKNETIETSASKTKGKKQQNEIGGLAHDMSAKHFSHQPQSLIPHINVSKDNFAKQLTEMVELKEKAQAAGMSTIKGSSQNPLVKLGGKIKIKAIKLDKKGDTDYGEYIITSIKHICDNLGGYENNFKGVSAETTVPDYADPEVKISCEPQTAIVTDNKDPEKLGRVKVHFAWQESGQSTPWIRIANPHSGVGRGMYFTPDIDDEVMVGFEGNYPELPFVMGSVYNGNGKPNGEMPHSSNSVKGMMFKGLSLQFNESTGTTTIKTPDKKQIILSDKEKSIKIEDENKNFIELSPDGIVLNTMKDLSITAGGNLSITAGKSLDITCGQAMSTTAGQSIVYSAGAKFSVTSATASEILAGTNASITGGVSAELKGATTTIQGALVKIN